MPREIPPTTSLIKLRKEARRWLRALRADDRDARTRLQRAWPGAPARPVLRDVQHALAREFGYDGWIALRHAVAQRNIERRVAASGLRATEDCERAARDMVSAFDAQDEVALQRLRSPDPVPRRGDGSCRRPPAAR